MKNLKINLKKLKALIIAGSLSLAMTGCGSQSTKNSSESSESTSEITTEVTTEETTTKEIDENQKYYDIIDQMEDNVVEFAENYLPYGFGEVEINDNNKQAISEMYTNAYIMLNVRDMGKSLAVLDQELDVIPSEAAKDFMKFARLTAHYSQIQTPDTMLDFSSIVMDENDAEFLNKLSEEIAYMNVATDSKERQDRINNIIAIKESLNEYYELGTYDYSTMYMAINLIIEADATAKAYGNEIFTSEEDKNQVYNTILKYNCGELEQEDLTATAISIEDVQAKNSLESKVSVYYKELLEDMLTKVENMGLGNFDSYYSFKPVTGRIADKLVDLYVAPEQTNIELENSIREQGPANGKDGIGETTIITDIQPDQVPEESKIPDKVEYDNSDNGKDINEVNIDDDTIIIPSDKIEIVDAETAKIRGEADGRIDGSAAAYNKQVSSGTIPSTISIAPTPSVPSDCSNYSSSYISGYKNGYIVAYNNYVNTAKSAQTTPTTTYEPVENGEEIIIDETITDIEDNTQPQNTQNSTTTYVVPSVPDYNQNGTYYIPVEDGNEVIIDEEIITISKSIVNLIDNATNKEQLYALGAMVSAGIDNYYNLETNSNAKRM